MNEQDNGLTEIRKEEILRTDIILYKPIPPSPTTISLTVIVTVYSPNRISQPVLTLLGVHHGVQM